MKGSTQGLMFIFLLILINALFKIFIFPIFTSLPYYDNLEAIYLGNFLEFGNYKHPPLLNFIMQFASTINSRSLFFLHIVPQIYFALVYIFVFKLSLKVVEKNLAVLATLLLSVFPSFSVSSHIFAQDVILALPFVASIYFYLNFLEKNKISDAILLGVFIGLGMLSKYFFILHAIAIFIHAVFYAKLYKNPKIYIAGLVSFIVFLPNLIWLIKHNFISISYGYSTGGDEKRHNALFLASNYFLITLGFVAVLSILSKKLPSMQFKKLNLIEYFVLSNFLILFFVMFFTGMAGKSRFLQMFYTIIPLFSCVIVKPNFNLKQIKVFCSIILVVISVSHFIECLKSTKKNKLENLDFKTMVLKIEEEWLKECGEKPIKYLFSKNSYMLGGIWWFLKDRPYFIPFNFANTPYLNYEDYIQNGGIIIYNEFKKEAITDDNENNDIKKIIFKVEHFKNKSISNNFLIGFKCPI